MRVSFALVVWGEAYVRDFLEFSLPTLLVDGNLVDNPLIDGSRFQILTTKADFDLLAASPLFRRLQDTLPVDHVDIGTVRVANKYQAVSSYQTEAIRRSEDYDAIALLYPDIIWARGAIQYAVERMTADNALAVFSPGPTVTPEAAKAALITLGEMAGPPDAQTISVGPQQLAGIVMDHHHPMWDGFDWDGNNFTSSPACMRWNVPGQGWLIRCYHLHPVIMKVQRDNPIFFADIGVSLDGEHTARLFDGTDRLVFATDTRFFALASVRDAATPPLPNPGNRASVTSVAQWAEANVLVPHRAFANIAFRWHTHMASEADWSAVEARSQNIISDIVNRLHTPDSVLRSEDPVAYRMRKRPQYSAAPRQIKVMLPPSRGQRSRSDLLKMLGGRLSNQLIFHVANLAHAGPWGKALRRNAAASRIWQRIKRAIKPKSELDAAVSSRTLIRGIMRNGTDKSTADR